MKKKLAAILLAVVMMLYILPTVSIAADAGFTDVKGHWAESEIMNLSKERIIGGYSDGTFKPGNPVTRYQAAAMLVKALKLPLVSTSTTTFKDISKESPMYQIAATINDAGIIRGSNGAFRPNEPVTRAQMATILTRAFELERNNNFYFTDIQPDYWNYNEVAALAKSGITGGKGDGTFVPSESTSRAHFSAFLYRAMNEERTPIQPLAGEFGKFVELDGLIYGAQGVGISVISMDSKGVAKYIKSYDNEYLTVLAENLKEFSASNMQVMGDKILLAIWTKEGKKELFTFKDDKFERFSKESKPNMYYLGDKLYYTQGTKLMERNGEIEKVVKVLPRATVEDGAIDYAGSKVFYSSDTKVYSLDLHTGKEKVLYTGKVSSIDAYRGKLVILLKPYGQVIVDLNGKKQSSAALGSYITESEYGLSIRDAADGGAGFIPR